jgi:hypothetical protein
MSSVFDAWAPAPRADERAALTGGRPAPSLRARPRGISPLRHGWSRTRRQPAPTCPPSPARPGRAERPRGSEPRVSRTVSAGSAPTSPRIRSRCQISDSTCDDQRVCTTFRGRKRLNHRIPDCGATGNHPSRGRYSGATREFVAGRAPGQCPPCNFPQRIRAVLTPSVPRARFVRACLAQRRRRRSCSPLRLGEPALAGDCQF